jgi:hypothetical protein
MIDHISTYHLAVALIFLARTHELLWTDKGVALVTDNNWFPRISEIHPTLKHRPLQFMVGGWVEFLRQGKILVPGTRDNSDGERRGEGRLDDTKALMLLDLLTISYAIFRDDAHR